MSSNNEKVLVVFLAATLSLASASASAQDNYDERYQQHYEDPEPIYDFAKVVDVQPLTTRVRVTTPQRECWDETRYENAGYEPGPHGPQVAGSTLLGAAIGGAIGHQQGMRRYGQTLPPREYTVQRCETRDHEEWQERVDGYRVTYLYQGRRQVTELPNRPGDRIRVRVDVSPAE